jgi:hypothetical protein
MMAWCMTARIDYFKTVNDITVFKCLEREANYWLNPASEKTVPADKKESYLGTVKNVKTAFGNTAFPF